MNCPSSSTLEDLVAGRLEPDQQEHLLGHVSHCVVCSREVAFLRASSLVLQGLSSEQDCLSDEMLCAFADGALDEEENEQVMEHISRCDDCSAALANLVRSLDETFSEHSEPKSPPVALLNRAIRIGAQGRSASKKKDETKGILSFFTNSSLPWRMGFAGLVASAVLILVVVVRGPSQKASHHDLLDAGLKAWRAQQLAEHEKPALSHHVQKPDHDFEDSGHDVASNTEQSTDKTKSVSVDALASLSSKRRGVVARRLVPVVVFSGLESKAFSPNTNVTSSAYGIGRAIVFLEKFKDYAMESKELGDSMAKVLVSLEEYVRSSSMKESDRRRLVKFISGLARNLDSGRVEPGKASRRIDVLCKAIRDIMEKGHDTGPGLKLGELVQGWSTDVLSGKRGRDDKLKKVREIIRSGLNMDQKVRKAALSIIDEMEKSAGIKDTKQRTVQVLEELRNFDHMIVSESPTQ